VLTPVAPRRSSISLTALAFALLSRAAREADLNSRRDATRALKTLEDEQAAVGRWYAYVGRPQRPMSVDQWATTLSGLAEGRGGGGFLTAGATALAGATFAADGSIGDSALVKAASPAATARVYALFSLLGDAQVTGRAFPRLLDDLAAGGPYTRSLNGDQEATAWLALAFARQLQDQRDSS
jgi:hypothetical protein